MSNQNHTTIGRRGLFKTSGALLGKTAVTRPAGLTGEDIYLKENVIKVCENHAVSKIHPDISTSGGILDPSGATNVYWIDFGAWRREPR